MTAIFGIIIGIALTAAAAGGLSYIFQEQVDPFSSTSGIDVTKLNAIRDNDRLTITATLKNIGQTSLSEITLDSISVSDITITQNAHGHIIVSDNDNNDASSFCVHTDSGTVDCEGTSPNGGTVASTNTGESGNGVVRGLDDRDYAGISVYSTDGAAGSKTESALEGGRSQVFKLVIDLDGGGSGSDLEVPEIDENVRISDKLALTLQLRSGDDVTVSDVYTARIRSN